MSNYEKMHAIFDWWDGPKVGVVDYKRKPHIYHRVFDELVDDYIDVYRLTPITEEEFKLLMELNEIFERWVIAFHMGMVSRDTTPLSEDKERNDELESLTNHLFDPNLSTLEVKIIDIRLRSDYQEREFHNPSLYKLEVLWEDKSI